MPGRLSQIPFYVTDNADTKEAFTRLHRAAHVVHPFQNLLFLNPTHAPASRVLDKQTDRERQTKRQRLQGHRRAAAATIAPSCQDAVWRTSNWHRMFNTVLNEAKNEASRFGLSYGITWSMRHFRSLM